MTTYGGQALSKLQVPCPQMICWLIPRLHILHIRTFYRNIWAGHKIYRVYAPYYDKIENADAIARELTTYPADGSTRVVDGMLYVRFR